MSSLRVENLSICIGGKKILSDISYVFPAGKRTAIIGPNGSGKSTLLQSLAGNGSLTSGRVMLDERNVRAFGKKELARLLAILPQGAQVPPDITVAELVDYGRFAHRRWFGNDAGEDKAAVAWALEQTKTAALSTRQVATLSGGERQRAWLAMALAQQPQVLLLDEPTTYLDIAHQLEVMEIVAQLNRESALTVVMVLHDINHARRYADEVVVIKDQHIVASGDPNCVLDPSLLERVFGVTADIFINAAGQTILSPLALVK